MTPVDIDATLNALPPCRPKMAARLVRLPLREPFRISDHTFDYLDAVTVELEADGHRGLAEAAGVFYLGDDAQTILTELAKAKGWIEEGFDPAMIAQRIRSGGARNALDCALWDLQARRAGTSVWNLLGMERPRPLLTTFTVGSAKPAEMATKAISYAEAHAIKIKLSGDQDDAERVRAVRKARPDVWLGVDANRSLTRQSLTRLMPVLSEAGVRLIEQPFPVGRDEQLVGLDLPVPTAADESVQTLADLERLAPIYQAVNIKLDKCGGLTEAMRIAVRARSLGLEVMVGNMIGTSLAMAPAYLVGQYCGIVDLDGPIFLRSDVMPGVSYQDGFVECPDTVWGGGTKEMSPLNKVSHA
jgi:L-alanine-DL-glutamate epimerase-like enolase superfamily enzyme